MTLALFIIGFFFTFATISGLLILGYRSRAHSAEARANRAEGALEVSQHNLGVMAEITRECVKGIGLDPKRVVPDEVLGCDRGREACDSSNSDQWFAPQAGDYEISVDRSGRVEGRYISAIVAFCPSCNVSVRHDPSEYPVPCPACKTLIDPVLDNPPEL